VAAASLESSSDYAVRLVSALQETAAQLRAGRIEQGNRLYSEVTDALRVLLYALAAAAQVLGEDAASLEGLEGELQPWLEALVEAQKTWDWLRVADYLEFEVAELVTGWRQRIEAVRRTLEGRSHAGC
jgi:ABC-type transporter Mla subunit MlaD